MPRALRFLLVLALAFPVAAFAQESASPPDPEAVPAAEPPPAPVQTPPAPATPSITTSTPAGQWVYTEQYGWIFMPYGSSYTSAPYDGEPYMFVYGPALGWTWVAAPWLWGWGPTPYFGVYGGLRFSWWGHGWGPTWRFHRPLAFRHRYPYPIHERPWFRDAPRFRHVPSFRDPERFEQGRRERGWSAHPAPRFDRFEGGRHDRDDRPARPAFRPERGGQDRGGRRH